MHGAAQLRQLPLRNALMLQQQIQNDNDRQEFRQEYTGYTTYTSRLLEIAHCKCIQIHHLVLTIPPSKQEIHLHKLLLV
jgi:hypothetical protein